MNKAEFETSTDDSGALRIQIPGRPSRYRVHVTIEWEEAPPEGDSQWPPGWLDATAGSIDDPTFSRPAQVDYETREKLD
jgi:hypothetical protein